MSNSLDIYPAIDLRNGQVVRLKHGDPNQQTVFGDDAIEVARRWAEMGTRWLHIVNLDGAFGDDASAAAKNRSLLKPLCAVGPQIQFGGGLRSLSDVEAALSIGVARVVLGTLAIEQPARVEDAVRSFGASRIVVGLDVRDGRIKTRGWQADGGVEAITIGQQLRSSGVEIVIHTDIARDGDLSGVNVEASSRLARATGLRVIASGGVNSIDDAMCLKNAPGIEGVIIGRALYAGAIDLRAALTMIRGE
jgi:phosphoribosylformimino-5-aminoimidazole carboxamide ribotide isomerase